MRRLGLLAAGAFALAAGVAAAAGAPPGYSVYVSNEGSGDLSIIDGASQQVVATVPLGKQPRGLAIAPDGTALYVALGGAPAAPDPGEPAASADTSAAGVALVDLAQRKVVAILRGVTSPVQPALSVDGARLFVATSEAGGTLLTIDVTSGAALEQAEVGADPSGVAASPDSRYVYATSARDGALAVLDAGTGRFIKRFKVGKNPRAVAFARTGSRAYVANEGGASVSVIDAARNRTLRTIALGARARPAGLAVSQDGSRLYVATGTGGSVLAIDTSTGKVIKSLAVGGQPGALALGPDGRFLYCANAAAGDVAVIATAGLKLVTTVKVGARPWGVVATPRR